MRSPWLPLPIFQPERWLELPATKLQEIYVLDSRGGKEIFWAQEPSGDSVQVVQGQGVEALPEAQEVAPVVYDVLGREVVRRRPGCMAADWHRMTLAAGNWPSGSYVVTF
ncbi:hypothetical protein [Rhodothermus profundi]|nr:hypothetical protein [Rhodothermus profundi]